MAWCKKIFQKLKINFAVPKTCPIFALSNPTKMKTKINALFTISLRDAYKVLCYLEDINFPPNAIIQMSSNTFLVTDDEIFYDLCDIFDANNFEYSIS